MAIGTGTALLLGAGAGLIGARAHQAALGAVPAGQAQRAQKNGFACAGLATENAKAVGDFKLKLPHDHEIAQTDALQTHEPPSFQCNFCLSVSK